MVALAGLFLLPAPLWAGDYLNSAHGSNSYGVKRSGMTGYARGNCAHCHEMHASIAGSEPLPPGGPSPYTLFATNFNSGTSLPGSYDVADNFCFYCHSVGASVQPVTNEDYSETFGGASGGVQAIREAFNQTSYHDLADIQTFMTTGDGAAMAPWYSADSNPCNACHNPHLAKRNYEDFLTPLSSAISKPRDHFALWGESETMASDSYEPPYSTYGGNREPDGISPVADSAKTPDYVGFCTDCHNVSNTSIPSTTLGTLREIDWLSIGGEKHGGGARDGTPPNLDARAPYATAIANGNFVLSCLDCHEPHGSPNIMLLRRRVNGSALNATITSINAMGALCRQCHKDDAAAVGGSADQWRYVHHDSSDAPYPGPPVSCSRCHNITYGTPIQGGKPRIYCGLCHFHGSDDSWMNVVDSGLTTYRKTF